MHPYSDSAPPLSYDAKIDIRKRKLSVSVWLGGDTNIRRKIRCIYCSRVLSEINGEVKQITTGDSQPGLEARAVVIQCYDCKTLYSLMD